jgi:uncharacterized protein (TIGR00369 family)
MVTWRLRDGYRCRTIVYFGNESSEETGAEMPQDRTAPDTAWWHPTQGATVNWLTWANALPYCRDVGLVCVELNATSAIFHMERSTLTPNPNGAVNGGTVAAAADQIMGALTMRMSAPGLLPATGSLHIQFHLPAWAPLTFRATVLGGGRRTKFVEVVVEDRDGNRCATSQGTMIAGGSAGPPLPSF